MKLRRIGISAAVTLMVLATASQWASANNSLSLNGYLEEVKANSPEARAALHSVEVSQARLMEAEVPLSPEFYAEYKLTDNRAEPTGPFSPRRLRGRVWKVGVKEQTAYGLSADVYFTSTRANLMGVNSLFIPPAYQDYEQTSLGLGLKQSLLRDFLGDSTRAGLASQKAASRAELLKRKFELKNIILKAENAYWSLVSYNEIVKLQTENVERAKRLSEHMRGRARLRLYDDVDAMQAEAAYEQRQLELLASVNERAGFVRQFNTLRGKDGEEVEALYPLPTEEFMLKVGKKPGSRMSREDFQMLMEQATASDHQARASLSKIRPQLDLVGNIASNGFDSDAAASHQEAGQLKNPSWSVGLVFSAPLDHWLLQDMRRSYRQQAAAARDQKEMARFNEERAWDDLVQKNQEAQRIFERSLKLEKIQTDLVQRERRRMLNGRSTVSQTLTIEQNLASAQVARIRAQLGLLQVHNIIKQFEEQK